MRVKRYYGQNKAIHTTLPPIKPPLVTYPIPFFVYVAFGLFKANVAVRWAGWRDTLAGIKQYELTVYKMKLYGDKLAHHGVPELLLETLGGIESETTVMLVETGKASRLDVVLQSYLACCMSFAVSPSSLSSATSSPSSPPPPPPPLRTNVHACERCMSVSSYRPVDMSTTCFVHLQVSTPFCWRPKTTRAIFRPPDASLYSTTRAS